MWSMLHIEQESLFFDILSSKVASEKSESELDKILKPGLELINSQFETTSEIPNFFKGISLVVVTAPLSIRFCVKQYLAFVFLHLEQKNCFSDIVLRTFFNRLKEEIDPVTFTLPQFVEKCQLLLKMS